MLKSVVPLASAHPKCSTLDFPFFIAVIVDRVP